MGTAILLNTADFSQSGFKSNETIVDYLNYTGTNYDIQTTFFYSGNLLYRGPVFMETAGKSLNKISVVLNAKAGAQPLIVAKYNLVSHAITNIQSIPAELLSIGMNEIQLDSVLVLAENECLMLASNDSAKGPVIAAISDVDSVYRWTYVQANGTVPSGHATYDTKAPRIKVELVYD